MNLKRTVMLLLAGFAVILPAAAGGIEWETSGDEAYARANAEGRNVLVLLTAPDWCGWCTAFEEEILSLPEVQEYISENYIPLKILDRVDGEKNPELVNYSYSGFPTVRVYDASGGYVDDAYTFDPDHFLQVLAAGTSRTGTPVPSLMPGYSITGDVAGHLDRKAPDVYRLTLKGGKERTFRVMDRDETFFYIYCEADEDYIAVPFEPDFGGLCNYNGGDWTEWVEWGYISATSR